MILRLKVLLAEAQDIKDSVKNKGLSSTIKVLSKKAGQATVVGGLSAIGLLPIALIAAKKFSKDNDRARKDAIEQIDKELLIAEVKMEKYKSEGKPGLYAKWVITRKKLLQAKDPEIGKKNTESLEHINIENNIVDNALSLEEDDNVDEPTDDTELFVELETSVIKFIDRLSTINDISILHLLSNLSKFKKDLSRYIDGSITTNKSKDILAMLVVFREEYTQISNAVNAHLGDLIQE